MHIIVNGKPETLPDRATVADLIAHLDLRGSPCAVEVNKALIPKRRHESHFLEDGDTIEVVTLVGGG